jgi:hypothetical protein
VIGGATLFSHPGELVLRFLIGGVIVSIFAVLAEIFRPKTFAGLFGAAPSVALATIGITIHENGTSYAALETRSMVLGAIAFLCYASLASWILMRFKPPALAATIALLPVWLCTSLALWYVVLR